MTADDALILNRLLCQIEIPCREWYGDRVLIGDEFISADGDKINDKIKSVLLKISELGIAERKDLHDAIKISMSTKMSFCTKNKCIFVDTLSIN